MTLSETLVRRLSEDGTDPALIVEWNEMVEEHFTIIETVEYDACADLAQDEVEAGPLALGWSN